MKIKLLYHLCMLSIITIYLDLSCYTTGSIELQNGLGTFQVSRIQGCIYTDIQTYVNGGVTFTYPDNFFIEAPSLLVTIILTGRPYSSSEIVVAEVVATTAAYAVVRVNVASLLSSPMISEASTGDVQVYIRAVGI